MTATNIDGLTQLEGVNVLFDFLLLVLQLKGGKEAMVQVLPNLDFFIFASFASVKSKQAPPKKSGKTVPDNFT